MTTDLCSRPELLSHGEPPSGPRAVHRAVDLIEGHPERPLSVSSLARQFGVSVRSLQEAFRRNLGVSPTAYLREIRLRRAHADLLAADPDEGLTVTDVAGRWGFAHLGRFSASYRERYGEPPSQTLRR